MANFVTKPKGKHAQPLEAIQYDDALLRLSTVQAIVGLSRTTVYARMAASPPTFPSAIRQGKRCTRWRAGDVKAWLKAQAERGA